MAGPKIESDSTHFVRQTMWSLDDKLSCVLFVLCLTYISGGSVRHHHRISGTSMQQLADALPASFAETWASACRDVLCRQGAADSIIHLLAHELPRGTGVRSQSCRRIGQKLCFWRKGTMDQEISVGFSH